MLSIFIIFCQTSVGTGALRSVFLLPGGGIYPGHGIKTLGHPTPLIRELGRIHSLYTFGCGRKRGGNEGRERGEVWIRLP